VLAVSTVQAQLGQITAMFPDIDVATDDIDAVVQLKMTQSQLNMLLGLLGP
jgi:hypothetical protein